VSTDQILTIAFGLFLLAGQGRDDHLDGMDTSPLLGITATFLLAVFVAF
jgi:hypothetical protein